MNSKISKCPVCASPGIFFKSYLSSSSILAGRSIHSCSNCGFYYVYEMPSENQLMEYNSSYWSNAHSHSIVSDHSNPWFNLMATMRHNYIREHITLDNLSILEIGPGEGYLAKSILLKHDIDNYDVIESDTSTHQALKNLSINVYSDLNSISSSRRYDLVILSHVLEHVSTPFEFISVIKQYISRSGYIFIEVPCLDLLHKDSHEPHLLFFDKPSLSYLLNKSLFNILDSVYVGTSLSDLPKSTISEFSFKVLQKLYRFIPGLKILLPNIESLASIESDEQKLLCLYHACHLYSSTPSYWLRAIAQL